MGAFSLVRAWYPVLIEAKVSVIAVIKKGDAILMRKKLAALPSFQETWYL
jgi:hypothetical protein